MTSSDSGDWVNPDRLLREHLELLRREADRGRGMSLRAVENRLKIKRSTFHSWLQEDGPIPAWGQLEPIVELFGGNKDKVRALRKAAIAYRGRMRPSTQAEQSLAIISPRSGIEDCGDSKVIEATPTVVAQNYCEPPQGDLQTEKKRSKLITAMGLVSAVVGLFLASGSSSQLVGISGSPPVAEATVTVRREATPIPYAKSNPTIEFLKAKAERASSEAQAVQAEIEALAAAQIPGDRSKIIERIRELSRKKSALEADVGYYRRAIHQMAN
ncbi:hypothetical protein [Nonomuraea fuscirosea]|uniref:hypothetical protein n=1 Tax=Nonomuraea fuscirosea TaxID=1291556 RepID=UPI0033CABD84